MKKLLLTLFVPIMLAQSLQTHAAEGIIVPILKHPATWLLGVPTVIAGATGAYLIHHNLECWAEAMRLARQEATEKSSQSTKDSEDLDSQISRETIFIESLAKHKDHFANSTLNVIFRRIMLGSLFTIAGTLIGAPLYAALSSDNGLIKAAGLLQIYAILNVAAISIAMNSSDAQ